MGRGGWRRLAVPETWCFGSSCRLHTQRWNLPFLPRLLKAGCLGTQVREETTIPRGTASPLAKGQGPVGPAQIYDNHNSHNEEAVDDESTGQSYGKAGLW